MMTNFTVLHEKYRSERSAELALACDITPCSISAVFYDLALERRYSRSAAFGKEFTVQTILDELAKLIITALREYSIKPAAVRRAGFAAPVYIETALEHTVSSEKLGLSAECEIMFVPYISAGISGRFTASLLTLPNAEEWAAADFGRTLCIAHKTANEIRSASFPLLGAFDGSALESGMPAEKGAIDSVHTDADGTRVYEVVGDCDSVGISPCGALMCAVEMKRAGILDNDGIMTDRDLYFIGEDYFISQSDIRAIQADKAFAAAAVGLLPQMNGNVFFSGEPFSTAGGFRALLELGGIPERFGTAAFCRNSTEQGIISYLESEEVRARANELIRSAIDISPKKLPKYDKDYLKNLRL